MSYELPAAQGTGIPVSRMTLRERRVSLVHRARWMVDVTKAAWLRMEARMAHRPLSVFSLAGGLGDELMALGVVQCLAKTGQYRTVRFQSRYAKLFQGNQPGLELVPYEKERLQARSVRLTYRQRTGHSINSQLARLLGLRTNVYPIELPPQPDSFMPARTKAGQKVIVIQPVASGWTPNKQWPAEQWAALLDMLPKEALVLEVGQVPLFQTPPAHPGYVNLVGATRLEGYLAVIERADVFIGPPSSGMHVAHAYGIPSIAIVGGYEAPVYPYPKTVQLAAPTSCAPCWRRDPCPYATPCLSGVPPQLVMHHLHALLERGR